jgi:hypothetical protein
VLFGATDPNREKDEPKENTLVFNFVKRTLSSIVGIDANDSPPPHLFRDFDAILALTITL